MSGNSYSRMHIIMQTRVCGYYELLTVATIIISIVCIDVRHYIASTCCLALRLMDLQD